MVHCVDQEVCSFTGCNRSWIVSPAAIHMDMPTASASYPDVSLLRAFCSHVFAFIRAMFH